MALGWLGVTVEVDVGATDDIEDARLCVETGGERVEGDRDGEARGRSVEDACVDGGKKNILLGEAVETSGEGVTEEKVEAVGEASASLCLVVDIGTASQAEDESL